MDLIEQVRQNLHDALRYISDRHPNKVDVGIILGSGLGTVIEEIDNARIFQYNEIPHFPRSTTAGHAGNLVLGKIGNKQVAVMQGRFHYYEGYTSAGIAFPVRLLNKLGAKILLVTCAAGGLQPDMRPGELLVIRDHVNMMGINPLTGPNDNELGPRFVDMTEAYDRALIDSAKQVAEKDGIELREGVYVGVHGPSYETPAEVAFLSTLGDVVGMSTVPEVIVSRHCGMRTAGFAVITNVHNTDSSIKLSHDEVLAEAGQASKKLSQLILDLLSTVDVASCD